MDMPSAAFVHLCPAPARRRREGASADMPPAANAWGKTRDCLAGMQSNLLDVGCWHIQAASDVPHKIFHK